MPGTWKVFLEGRAQQQFFDFQKDVADAVRKAQNFNLPEVASLSSFLVVQANLGFNPNTGVLLNAQYRTFPLGRADIIGGRVLFYIDGFEVHIFYLDLYYKSNGGTSVQDTMQRMYADLSGLP